MNPELITLLICPNCGGGLLDMGNELNCVECNRNYEIKDGIPILYHDNIDLEHLCAEERLAQMMLQSSQSLSGYDQFVAKQWRASKREFWSMVRSNLAPSPRTIVNLGCGYDSRFRHVERAGYSLVNFDIVYDMVHHLKEKHGAKMCVVGDIKNPPLKKNFFDYVISIDVIHHEYNNLNNLLSNFKDLLKPGGLLFLSDPHSLGMFQFMKSALLPKTLYRLLRSIYQQIENVSHQPADYEFATNFWRTKNVLKTLGFTDITAYPNYSYPNISEIRYRIYNLFKSEWVRKYHNYHYMLSAKRT
jgi:SAM-dependent methyltransferase